MQLPENRFKARLRSGACQLGLWNTVGGNTMPEILGGAGFDWVLVDCEHAAIETVEVLPALQAIGQNSECSALVRPAANDPVLFKRVLDMGAQTLLVPYIENQDQAELAVSAMRYGPRGVRGMAGMTRATRYGQVEDYFTQVEKELCLILQIESRKGLENLQEIASTEGVDGIFIGPADLSASLGHPGNPDHPEVQAAIDEAIDRLEAWNIPWGIMSLNPDAAKGYISKGAAFVCVGVDLVLLADALQGLKSTMVLA